MITVVLVFLITVLVLAIVVGSIFHVLAYREQGVCTDGRTPC